MKQLLLSVATMVTLTSATFAQVTLVEVKDDTMVAAFGAEADTVDDWDVVIADGTEVGEVEEVVGSDRMTPTALVVDFEGKAGYGDRDVVVPIGQFTLNNGKLILNADAAAVRSMQVWND